MALKSLTNKYQRNQGHHTILIWISGEKIEDVEQSLQSMVALLLPTTAVNLMLLNRSTLLYQNLDMQPCKPHHQVLMMRWE